MTTTPLPEVFHDLARTLARKPHTLNRAKYLSDALKAIPDLQAHLRGLRQDDVLALKADGTTYTAMAPALECQPERVSAIARDESPRKDLPEPFKALKGVLGRKAGTLARAAVLTELLKAVPDLQAHLRELRQEDVRHLKEGGMSYTSMAETLGVERERVSAIARNAPSGKAIRAARGES